ncbi:MAG: ArsA family ATPase [Bryobacteraceae bacterium]
MVVYLGTGGVGKTSVAAATGVAQARSGLRSLVLTIDPALRLRSALRLRPGLLEQPVDLDPEPAGELWAALLDVRATLDEAVKLYAPEALVKPILTHPIYSTIADSLVGMQELMAVERIDQLSRRGFSNIVIDTAPSRHALEFLDKPMFFADLAGSNLVRMVGRTYKFVARSGLASFGRRTVDFYKRVEGILGADMVRQILDFYSLFVSIAEGYADRAEKTVGLLKDPDVTEFRIVTTPQKALRDARYFVNALEQRRFHVGALYINRVWNLQAAEPASSSGLRDELLGWYSAVRNSHTQAIEQVRSEFHSRIPLIGTLPELERDIDGLPALEKIAPLLAPR